MLSTKIKTFDLITAQLTVQSTNFWLIGSIIVCCMLGSAYATAQDTNKPCIRILNFMVGVVIGFFGTMEYGTSSVAVSCLMALVLSGSGAMVYSIVIATVPKIISEKVIKKLDQLYK